MSTNLKFEISQFTDTSPYSSTISIPKPAIEVPREAGPIAGEAETVKAKKSTSSKMLDPSATLFTAR